MLPLGDGFFLAKVWPPILCNGSLRQASSGLRNNALVFFQPFRPFERDIGCVDSSFRYMGKTGGPASLGCEKLISARHPLPQDHVSFLHFRSSAMISAHRVTATCVVVFLTGNPSRGKA